VNVKLIVPAMISRKSRFWRPLKYSLWPPLGLATLAAYLREDDEVTLVDENVETLRLDDRPDLVGIQVYVSSANRAYAIADHYRSKGVHVALGGRHVTAMPAEAARHADTVLMGPGEDTWPRFVSDLREGHPGRLYRSIHRTLADQPPPRRDLIKRGRYLLPNSIAVSRGCPHRCQFCSNTSFFGGGKFFYTQSVDRALGEIERLPGRHLYFVDDDIFGNKAFAEALFDGMRGMGKIWQAVGTMESVFDQELLTKAAQAGLRSLLVGFETLNAANLRQWRKVQNLNRSYDETVRRLHDLGVLVNATFVLGMDGDDATVFDGTVEWAIGQGVETATFHILTPYPGTPLHDQMAAAGRITTGNWDLYDTSHVVFRPARMTAAELQEGYLRASRDFYRWGAIFRSAARRRDWRDRLRHIIYAGGWGSLDALWRPVVAARQISRMAPLLEAALTGFGKYPCATAPRPRAAVSGVGLPWHRPTRRARRPAAALASRPETADRLAAVVGAGPGLVHSRDAIIHSASERELP
jgi:radical SAM superfamily enzyme YgiQ (UPF0313 family)